MTTVIYIIGALVTVVGAFCFGVSVGARFATQLVCNALTTALDSSNLTDPQRLEIMAKMNAVIHRMS